MSLYSGNPFFTVCGVKYCVNCYYPRIYNILAITLSWCAMIFCLVIWRCVGATT